MGWNDYISRYFIELVLAMKIVADSDLPFVKAYFEDQGELCLKPGRFLERADVIDADLLLVRSVTTVDAKLLQRTKVKCVATVTTGIDHLDTDWLDQQGILWLSAAGYNAEPVSDYVLAVVAALQQAGCLPLSSVRVAVVGVGQVGRRVAQRFKCLGFEVFLSDPPRAEQEQNFISTALSELPPVDLLSLHTPLVSGGKYPTHHLINASFLKKARGKSILLNTSRGAVVDFSSLRASRDNWRYCFDVWEGEPDIDLEILRSTLIASPHMAGYSVQCRYRGIEMIYRALCEKGLVKPKITDVSLSLPRNKLYFDHRRLTWQEVVLAHFNPLSVTEAMKKCLLEENVLLKEPKKCATLFDKLRQQYIGAGIERHEFAYTTISQVRLSAQDRDVLTQLGFIIEE